METISYKVELPDPYQNAYERVTMEFEHRMRNREMEGIEAALKEYGYIKERTCKVVRRDRDEYGEFAEYSCGHANVWQSWSEPKFCCWCGAKVVE